MNIGGNLSQLLKTLEKDKKLSEGMIKEAKGNKEVEALLKNLQKTMGDQKKLLQDIDKVVKKLK